MNILFSVGFLIVGVALLWAAFTGKAMYYPHLGAMHRGPSIPMPPWRARLMYTVMGVGCLVIAIGSFIQYTFGWPPARPH